MRARPTAFMRASPNHVPGLRSGHMPGAHNLPFGELLTPQHTLLPPAELREKYQQAGVSDDAAVVTTCGSGLTAAILSLLTSPAFRPAPCTMVPGRSGAGARTRQWRARCSNSTITWTRATATRFGCCWRSWASRIAMDELDIMRGETRTPQFLAIIPTAAFRCSELATAVPDRIGRHPLVSRRGHAVLPDDR